MSEKIKELGELASIVQRAKEAGKRVVFTNGCFDLLHCGHLHLLREARKLGDLLIVAINSDESIHGIKGTARPIVPERERAELLAALEAVDFVTLFSEPDPLRVIQELKPDVLVKGGDWPKDEIIGGGAVEGTGGIIFPEL